MKINQLSNKKEQKKRLVNIGLTFFCLWIILPLAAQQLPTFINYNNNWNLLNPAAISPDFFLDDYYRLTLQTTYRQQWAEIPDAPQTQTIAGTWMSENSPTLLGGQLLNDKTGAIGLTGVYGQFAYRIKLMRKHFLSIGLNAGLVQYRVKVSEIKLLEKNDILANDDGRKIIPDFGLGVFYQFDDRVYAGFSIPQTFGFTNTFRTDRKQYKLTRTRHYYAMAGANFYLDNDKSSYFSLASWGKYLPHAPFVLDINAKYFFQNVFWLGIGGGTTDLAHLEVGVIVGQGIGYMDGKLSIGFGYDFALSSQTQLLGRTLEMTMRYSFEN